MTKNMVVIYTWMTTGHLVPMVEFAKMLSKNGTYVTVVVADTIPDSTFSSKAIANLSSANPSISFHLIPLASAPANSVGGFGGLLEQIRRANTPLTYLLQSLSETCSVRAIVIDFFLTYALDVARKLDILAYFFACGGASDLVLFLHLPKLDSTINTDFKDMGNTILQLPGLPPIPASHMPEPCQSHDDPSYEALLYHFARLPKGDGILINTFESLEEKAVKVLRDGLCLPDMQTPPLYCIGPIVSKGKTNKHQDKHECLTWLDKQPKKSVVFLSLGSMGAFPVEQLTEIAIGLENSSQRFIWVVRAPPPEARTRLNPMAAPLRDLNEVLPDGFLNRTKDRGMVINSWAPQPEVLSHSSVGAFVTHCGWNSILEAVTFGVPMICWPLYAEQRVNKILLVEEMKVAVEMRGYDEDLVVAKEIEEKMRFLIESEDGKVIREKIEGFNESAAEAMSASGSSTAALMDFLAVVEKDQVGVNY